MKTVKEIKADIAKDIQRYDDRRVIDMYRADVASGIPLDRLEEICDAEREGRCVVLEKENSKREKGCEACGLIYKLDGAAYGTVDELIDNTFCPMCGKKLPVYAGTIGGEIVQHAMKEMEK